MRKRLKNTKQVITAFIVLGMILSLITPFTEVQASTGTYTISWSKPLVSSYPNNPGGYIECVFPQKVTSASATCSKQIQYYGLDDKWHTANPLIPGTIVIPAGTSIYFHMYDNGGHTESHIEFAKGSQRMRVNLVSRNYRINNLITVTWKPNSSTSLTGLKGCCNREGEPVVWQIFTRG